MGYQLSAVSCQLSANAFSRKGAQAAQDGWRFLHCWLAEPIRMGEGAGRIRRG